MSADGAVLAVTDFTFSPEVAAVLLAFFVYNLIVVASTSQDDHRRRLLFVCMLFPQFLTAVTARFFVLRLTKLSSPLYWTLLLPLSVYETWSIQLMADVYEGRPIKMVSQHQVTKQIKTVAAEAFGLFLSYVVRPRVYIGGPTASLLLHAIWRAAIFDFGLDLGFYTFHRVCHKNRRLYRLVHAEHHNNAGKRHGHIVAHETYDLTMIEISSILGSYSIGFELLHLVYSCTLFDMALLVSWAHLIELLGHSQMAWTVNGNPLRTIPEILGLSLKIPDHTMHHTKPLSNFSKRLTLFDRVFGTYSPAENAYGTVDSTTLVGKQA